MGNLIEQKCNNVFILETIKETISDFEQYEVRVLWMCFPNLIKYHYKIVQCNSVNVKLSDLQL